MNISYPDDQLIGKLVLSNNILGVVTDPCTFKGLRTGYYYIEWPDFIEYYSPNQIREMIDNLEEYMSEHEEDNH